MREKAAPPGTNLQEKWGLTCRTRRRVLDERGRRIAKHSSSIVREKIA